MSSTNNNAMFAPDTGVPAHSPPPLHLEAVSRTASNTAMAPDTRTSSNSHARDKVISITELLVKILSHLHHKDLARAERVCKHFKALIEDSVKLQQRLFNVHVPWSGPAPLPVHPDLNYGGDGTPTVHPAEHDHPIVELNTLTAVGKWFKESSWGGWHHLDLHFPAEAISAKVSSMALTNPTIPNMQVSCYVDYTMGASPDQEWFDSHGPSSYTGHYETLNIDPETFTLGDIAAAEARLLDRMRAEYDARAIMSPVDGLNMELDYDEPCPYNAIQYNWTLFLPASLDVQVGGEPVRSYASKLRSPATTWV
ncbi:uncharacterized protein RCC_08793 [Ramularia collo-cygni]|uniref:F-box domain-containing protein n=1 Tax=Ramularia collo-cygni TaxID=112498 RepID=A0A2D3V518_9PEZI|nr:uncharacterized protein RCC_08793 [Ramularia collo-cygni]CZT23083.1 uncharacterized protein RCC_08793 [Ramularia collo-cygni]